MLRRLSAAVCLWAVATAASASGLSFDTVAAVRTPDGRVLVTWQADGPVDVLAADAPSQPLRRMRLVSDDDSDGRHVLAVRPTERLHLLLRSETTGRTLRLAERVLPLEGGSNFRDLGGYPAADGKHVRWGRIYRTGAMPRLTRADRAQLAGLGIGGLTDLRSVEERAMSPTDWRALGIDRYFAVDYPASELFSPAGRPVTGLYEAWPLSLRSQYRRIFRDLLAGRGATAFNCSAGQDRTGVATALVLSALGAPREVIYADYHLSTQLRRPENEVADVDLERLAPTNAMAAYLLGRRGLPSSASRPQPLRTPDGEPFLASTFRWIEGRYGSVERYLAVELGVGPAEVRRLRALYLE